MCVRVVAGPKATLNLYLGLTMGEKPLQVDGSSNRFISETVFVACVAVHARCDPTFEARNNSRCDVGSSFVAVFLVGISTFLRTVDRAGFGYSKLL